MNLEDAIEDAISIAATGQSKANGQRKPTTKVPSFKLTRFNSIKLNSTAVYVVKGLLPRQGLIVIWGPPKCGKSFWTFDIAMHCARKETYRGRKVRGGAVVYLALEGGDGFRRRIEAHRKVHGVDDAPFYLITDRTDLVRDVRALIDAITLQLGAERPVLVVIDTLNRSLAGSESKDEDMAAYIKAVDAIREAFNCAVIVVHHCGVDGTRPRGHTSLTGAVDAQIAVARDAADNIVATLEWMKDGAEGDVIVSRLEQVDLGLDEDGEGITSCIIVPVEGGPVRRTTTRRLSDRQRLALDALAECAAERGKAPPIAYALPASVSAVTVPEWREEVFRRGVLDRDAKNPREDFKRLRNALHARKLIGIVEDLVWRA
jgi:AAA domain